MSAILSDCHRYRYYLSREGDDLLSERSPAVFVMLNPSTADAQRDDATIRRCTGFARLWGYNGIVVVNLFALRARDPSEIARHPDPVGPLNDEWLEYVASQHDHGVMAWGANAPQQRAESVTRMLQGQGMQLWCLGSTQSGAPRHPLYVPGDRQLERWPQ